MSRVWFLPALSVLFSSEHRTFVHQISFSSMKPGFEERLSCGFLQLLLCLFIFLCLVHSLSLARFLTFYFFLSFSSLLHSFSLFFPSPYSSLNGSFDIGTALLSLSNSTRISFFRLSQHLSVSLFICLSVCQSVTFS